MKINLNKLLWPLFNLLIFAGWCVFAGFYAAREYPDANTYLIIVVLAAVFFAARVLANLLCQIGQAVFIKFLGFKLNYFEAAFFVWRYDGERGRAKFSFLPSSLWSGTVYPRVKGSLDTAQGYAERSANYGKAFLGAPLTAALILLAVIAYTAAQIIVGQPEPVGMAVAVGAWLMLYKGLTEDYRRRGGFLTYLKYRGDSEARLLGIASQAVVETPDRFLWDEAQKLIRSKIEADSDFLDRRAFNILSYLMLADALGEYALLPEIRNYIETELLTYEGLIRQKPEVLQMAIGRARTFVCFKLIAGGGAAAKNALELFARVAAEARMRTDTVYFADMRQILSDRDEETLAATDFLARDPYGGLFKAYAALVERADDAAHQALFAEYDEGGDLVISD
ncbi:MAG: hypothetical protein LBL66_07075 [Clostridiales bacterium]|nr:hypothetical protein [Clostridiales bacterium]